LGTEKQYDEIIAPMLRDVAMKCDEMGMALVARVEWKPDESGITQIGNLEASPAQRITHLAAHANGNIDALCLAILRQFDVSQSIFLYQHQKRNRSS
jgi:hypothetical protein